MIADIIVCASGAFAVAFAAAWLVRRDLRDWIERPKYQFQSRVQRYDREQSGMSERKGRADA